MASVVIHLAVASELNKEFLFNMNNINQFINTTIYLIEYKLKDLQML